MSYMTDDERALLLQISAMVHARATADHLALCTAFGEDHHTLVGTKELLDKVADLAQRIEAADRDTGVEA